MKISVAIISIIFAVGLLVGCGSKPANFPEPDKSFDQENKGQEELTIDGAIDKLKSAGFVLGQKEKTYYQIIGAYDGTKVDANSIKIEIYQYKDAQKEAKAKAKGTLATADSIIFEANSLLVLVHSKDAEFATSLENALK